MIDLLRLNEAQGMTATMVRASLERLGHPLRECQKFPVCTSLGKHTHHGKGHTDFAVSDTWDLDDNIWPAQMLRVSLQLAATIAGLLIQDLLCDINPRLRQGVPSEAAIHAHLQTHGGWWLAASTTPNYAGKLRTGHWTNKRDFCIPDLAATQLLYFHNIPLSWSFWPCDAHGNKMRWPEENGVLL